MSEFKIHCEFRTHLVDFELVQFSPTYDLKIDLELTQISNSVIDVEFKPWDMSKRVSNAFT